MLTFAHGYDVKNDYAEMVIASDVFTSSLSPAQNDVNHLLSSPNHNFLPNKSRLMLLIDSVERFYLSYPICIFH